MMSDEVYDAYSLIQKHKTNVFDRKHKCRCARMEFSISSEREFDGIPFIICDITGKYCDPENCPIEEIKECPKCKGKGYIYKMKKKEK